MCYLHEIQMQAPSCWRAIWILWSCTGNVTSEVFLRPALVSGVSTAGLLPKAVELFSALHDMMMAEMELGTFFVQAWTCPWAMALPPNSTSLDRINCCGWSVDVDSINLGEIYSHVAKLDAIHSHHLNICLKSQIIFIGFLYLRSFISVNRGWF